VSFVSLCRFGVYVDEKVTGPTGPSFLAAGSGLDSLGTQIGMHVCTRGARVKMRLLPVQIRRWPRKGQWEEGFRNETAKIIFRKKDRAKSPEERLGQFFKSF
jgi:hypothetical protein